MFTTQAQVREAFWAGVGLRLGNCRYTKSKRQNEYPTDVRVAFVDYVDSLARDGQISEKLAQRVTL